MKKLTGIALIVVVLLSGTSVFAQELESVSATASTTAVIASPLSIEKIEDLNFGILLSLGSAKAIVNQEGTIGGDATWGNIANVKSAKFNIVGDPGSTVFITLPNESYKVTNVSDSNYDMVVDDLISYPQEQITLDSTSGEKTIEVGATLHINKDQKSGIYTNGSDLLVAVSY